MNVRDSTGRSVSLLNDEPISLKSIPMTPYPSPCHASSFDLIQSRAIRSHTSSPATPALTRADSCDTLPSPITPSSPYPTSFQNAAYSLVTLNKEDSLVDYPHMTAMPTANRSHPTTSIILATAASAATKKLTITTSKFSSSNASPVRSHRPTAPYELRKAYMEPQVYDEDSYFGSAIPTERVPKRYPCRYRDSHHCLKTFTTSGHASRHSKIHTAEKGVSCTWYGCHKKFTRSDNMKQHLETHTKERSRASKSSTLNSITHPSNLLDSTKTVLTIPAGVKKLSSHRCNHRHGSQSHILSSSSSTSSSPLFPSTPTSLSSSPSFASPSFSSPSSIAYHSTKVRHRPHSLRSPSDMSSLLDPTLVNQLHIMVSGHSDRTFHSNNGLDALATAAGTRNLELK